MKYIWFVIVIVISDDDENY